MIGKEVFYYLFFYIFSNDFLIIDEIMNIVVILSMRSRIYLKLEEEGEGLDTKGR